MKVWSDIGTSPSKPPCQTCPQGGNISSSSFPPFRQRLLIKHSWQTPSQPRVFTEWGGQAENLLFPPWFSVWFSCFIPPEEEEGRASACPIACVNHSAHQNSSWVAPYPGDPAKHLALGSRIVPELWMLEKHSNNSDTDSCCYSNLKYFLKFFFCFFLFST